MHIAMNSWVLYDLGAQVEEVFGQARFIIIYFFATTGGFLASTFWSNSLSMGASAGIMGLIGAMIALGVTQRGAMAQQIRAVYIRWAVYLLIFSLLPGVDMMAHVGGGLAGFAIGYVAGLPGPEGTPRERLWRASSWFCILLTVISFLKLYLWFTQSPA